MNLSMVDTDVVITALPQTMTVVALTLSGVALVNPTTIPSLTTLDAIEAGVETQTARETLKIIGIQMCLPTQVTMNDVLRVPTPSPPASQTRPLITRQGLWETTLLPTFANSARQTRETSLTNFAGVRVPLLQAPYKHPKLT